jgi:hypothetical protein
VPSGESDVRDFGSLASRGCETRNETFLVEAKVRQALDKSVVLWDGVNSAQTIQVAVPDRGDLAEGTWGLRRRALNELGKAGRAVTVALRCTHARSVPTVMRLSYTNPDGLQQALRF